MFDYIIPFLLSVCSLSHVPLFVTPWTAACQASLSFTIYWSLLKLKSVELDCYLLSPSPPALSLSQHQGISSELALRIRWPKDWSFSFSISPSNEYSGLISFRIDWLNVLAVQGTRKSLLQHHSSKTSILQCSVFFIVQLSHPHMTTGKTKALTIWTFVGKVISLLFNMLSRFITAFLSRSKHLSISWLQSLSAMILETKKIVSHSFHCFPIHLM